MAKKEYKATAFYGERKHETIGTIDELVERFSYTLLCGHEYDRSVQTNPKTRASLEESLNDAAAVIGSRTHYFIDPVN